MKPTSDTWVGNKLIQNCHVRFGAGVICLVYVVPGLVFMINTIMEAHIGRSCIEIFLEGLALFVFFVPMSVIMLFINLMSNLITLNDYWLGHAKR